jgi:hypothetical protein
MVFASKIVGSWSTSSVAERSKDGVRVALEVALVVVVIRRLSLNGLEVEAEALDHPPALVALEEVSEEASEIVVEDSVEDSGAAIVGGLEGATAADTEVAEVV